MSVSKKTLKERRALSDARIIESAIKCFGKSGFTHTSLIQIAKNAGVTGALISQRYGTKEKLFYDVYFDVLERNFGDVNEDATPRECISYILSQIKNVSVNNPDDFAFFCMLYKSTDISKETVTLAEVNQKTINISRILSKAQKDGILPDGDVVKLVASFCGTVFLHLSLCKKYGLDIPEDDFYYKAIGFENNNVSMCSANNSDDKSYIKEQLIDILGKEYQTIWLISLKDMTMQIFKTDGKKSIPNSVNTALQLNSYDDARQWYVDNCVIEKHKDKVFKQTDLDYVLSMLKGGKSFFVEYGRLNSGQINFNQLCYDKIINPVTGENEYIALGFRNIDITKRAEFDDVTGLYLRQVFFKKAEEMLENYPNEQFDIVMSDIMDFKKINETYGAKCADDILRWQGRYLLNFASEKTIVGRYGGDQMVMFGTHNQIIDIVSSDSKEKYEQSERDNGLPASQVKLGVYLNVRKDDSIIASCDKAHTALNSIKHLYSKDVAYYNDEIKDHLDKQRRIENSMHESLENHDFKVYYQPKHSAQTGELIGAEALIRWIHPEYGFMSPADFIPLFEQNGFIEKIDEYVWNRTCENLRKWMDKGIKTVPISVNASILTMVKDNLFDDMINPVRKNNLSPSQLHIEVTETLMTENSDKLIKTLNKTRELGFAVELDDFGSGYSSLNVLSTFPIDILKLDMSFLQQFGDKKRSVVLESCIDMAQKLGFTTVSEGVELKEQRELLEKLGVDAIQGYYHSKPLPEDEFEMYMMEHSS